MVYSYPRQLALPTLSPRTNTAIDIDNQCINGELSRRHGIGNLPFHRVQAAVNLPRLRALTVLQSQYPRWIISLSVSRLAVTRFEVTICVGLCASSNAAITGIQDAPRLHSR